MSECIFCKIVNGEIPAKIVYKNEGYVAFEDLRPEAPVHVLVIPKRHVDSVNELGEADKELAGGLMLAAKQVAQKLGIEKAYRLRVYEGREAGQTVFHLHMHVLGGGVKPNGHSG